MTMWSRLLHVLAVLHGLALPARRRMQTLNISASHGTQTTSRIMPMTKQISRLWILSFARFVTETPVQFWRRLFPFASSHSSLSCGLGAYPPCLCHYSLSP